MKSFRVLNLVLFIINLILLIGIFWVWRVSDSSLELTDNSEVIERFVNFDENNKIIRLKDYKIDDNLGVNDEENNLSVFQSSTTDSKDDSVVEETTEVKELPNKINLSVPFTSQAPEKNWEQPWQDACEEAGVLMLDAFYKGYGLSPLFSKDEILKMVAWEDERGWKTSISVEKVSELGEWYIGTIQNTHNKIQIIQEPTVEQIKSFIASGNPVLVLAYGKDLPNPHFTNDGPEYHALIIRGYDEDEFITNDPGTQFGENFKYKYDDLMNAIHDWNGGRVEEGRRVVIIID